MLDDLSDLIRSKEVDCDVVERFNSAGIKSVSPIPKREAFMRDIQSKDYEKTVSKYTKPSLYKRARRFVGRIKSKILG